MDTELASRSAMEVPTPHRPILPQSLPHELVVPPQAVGLALATLEGLLGRRGLYQLRPRLSPMAFRQLVYHVDSGMFERSVLGRLRTQMPTPFAVEASAGIFVKTRWLACTLRLDRTELWECSDLSVVGVHRT